jgi:hypothetical protein
MADRVMTNAPVASDVVGKCFALTTEATRIRFRYSKVDLLYGGQLTNLDWAKKSEVRVLGTVPKGSQIVISNVVDAFNGETVRRWDVFGMLKGPNGSSIEVQIPSNSGIEQDWLVEWRAEFTREAGQKVGFKDKWLRPCGEATS